MPEGNDIFLEAEEIARKFRAKGERLSWNWSDTWREQHLHDFTVAHCAKIDVLRDLRDAVDQSLAEGRSTREIWSSLEQKLGEKGWLGTVTEENPSGKEETYQAGSLRRLDTIIQTNLAVAFSAGRYQADLASRDVAPLWMYDAINDSSTRPEHAALDGKVFPADDPFWNVNYPPNDWGCRCNVIPLSEEQAAGMGLEPESGVDEDGMLKPEYRDVAPPEWAYNPGQQPDEVLSVLWDKVTDFGDRAVMSEALKETANRIQAPWESWVDRVTERGRSAGESRIVGFMWDEELAWARAHGKPPHNGVIRVGDRLVVGKKADRHAAPKPKKPAGDALTTQEWKDLPKSLLDVEKVLWDTEKENFLYVLKSKPGEKMKIVVEPAFWEGNTQMDITKAVFKIYENALMDRTKYDVVR